MDQGRCEGDCGGHPPSSGHQLRCHELDFETLERLMAYQNGAPTSASPKQHVGGQFVDMMDPVRETILVSSRRYYNILDSFGV